MLFLALLILGALAYGEFGPKNTIANPGVAFASFADIDGDGLVDAVLALASRQSVGWHKNLGHDQYGNIRWGGFKQIVTTSNSISAITTHDVDLDGKPDIIFGVRFQGVFWISMRTVTGQGPYRLTSSGTPHKILVGDVNGDTIVDLVIGEADAGRVYFITGSRYSPFLQAYSDVTIISNGNGADGEIQLVNIDSDPHLDLILTNRASLKFYTNNGRGRFDIQRIVNVWTDTRVLVSDFDHDGKNEFLAVRQDSPSGVMVGHWPNLEVQTRFPGLQISSYMAVLNKKTGDFVAATPSGLWWFENNDFGNSFKQHYIGSVGGTTWDSCQAFTANLSGSLIRSEMDVAFISNQEFVSFYQLPGSSPPSYWPTPTHFVPLTNDIPLIPELPYVPPNINRPAQWTLVVVGVVVGVLIVSGIIMWLIKRKKNQANQANNPQTNSIALDDVTSSVPYDPNQTIQPSLIYTGATVPVHAGYGAPPGYFGGPAYVAPPTYSVADGGWVSQTNFGGPGQYPYPPNNVYI